MKLGLIILVLLSTIELVSAQASENNDASISVPVVFAARNHTSTLNGIDVGPPVEIFRRENIVEGRLKVLYPGGRVFDMTPNTLIICVSHPMASFGGKNRPKSNGTYTR